MGGQNWKWNISANIKLYFRLFQFLRGPDAIHWWNNQRSKLLWHINPNPCGWGRIWLPKLWTGITPQCLKLRKIFKLMYSSKNVSWVYLVKYFIAFLAIYRRKRARNCPFFCRFWLFRTAVKVYMTSPPPPRGRALPLPIVGTPSSSGTARTVSSSF
jgi:hypothetical protein